GGGGQECSPPGHLRAHVDGRGAAEGRHRRGHRDREEVQHARVESLHQRHPRSRAQRTAPAGLSRTIRYAILSDVHGNLEALTALHADAAERGAPAILCLGDAVGYGAEPGACIEAIGERAVACVAGNHEHGALGLMDLAWFNPVARTAALWTRDALAADQYRYLETLPLRAVVDQGTLVHSSPRDRGEWDSLLSGEAGFDVFGDFDTRLCFVGHSHRPGVWSLGSAGPDHDDAPRPGTPVTLDAGRRYIVNVGSVGQPR